MAIFYYFILLFHQLIGLNCNPLLDLAYYTTRSVGAPPRGTGGGGNGGAAPFGVPETAPGALYLNYYFGPGSQPAPPAAAPIPEQKLQWQWSWPPHGTPGGQQYQSQQQSSASAVEEKEKASKSKKDSKKDSKNVSKKVKNEKSDGYYAQREETETEEISKGVQKQQSIPITPAPEKELYGKFYCREKQYEIPSLILAEKNECIDKKTKCKHHCFWKKSGLLTPEGTINMEKGKDILKIFPKKARAGLQKDFVDECIPLLQGKKCKEFGDFDACTLKIYAKHCINYIETQAEMAVSENSGQKKKPKKSKYRGKGSKQSEQYEEETVEETETTEIKTASIQPKFVVEKPITYTYTTYEDPKTKKGEKFEFYGPDNYTDVIPPQSVFGVHKSLLGFRCKDKKTPIKYSQKYQDTGNKCLTYKIRSYACRKVCHLSALGIISKNGSYNEIKFGDIFVDEVLREDFIKGFTTCKEKSGPYTLSPNCVTIEPMLDCIRNLFEEVCMEKVPEDYDIYKECGKSQMDYTDIYRKAWTGCAALPTFACRKLCQFARMKILNANDGSFNLEKVGEFINDSYPESERDEAKKVYRKCDEGKWRNYTVHDGCEGARPLINCLHDGYNEVCFNDQKDLYIPHPEI